MSPKKIISRTQRAQSFSGFPDLKILVTAIGGRAAYNFIRCLKESYLGKRLSFVGADMSPDHPRLLCDEFVILPHPESRDYLPEMQKAVERLGIDMVIPTSDEECLALAKNCMSLGNINTLPIGEYSGVMSAKDKLGLYGATKHLGIVPATAGIQKGSGIGEIRKLVGIPAFIKPQMGRGGRYTHIIRGDSPDEERRLNEYWRSFADDFGPPICQEFIESRDYGIDAYINSSGKIYFGAVRKKLKVAKGDKIIGMNSVSMHSPKIEEACRKIIEALGLRGLIEIEMRKDNSGKIHVLDVNPRVGGSIYLSKASGRNIAMLPVLDYLREPYPDFDYKAGVEIVRSEIEKNRKKFLWDFVASPEYFMPPNEAEPFEVR